MKKYEYWITRRDGIFELRQTRFKEQYVSGHEHPWDVCAVATRLSQLKSMAAKHLKGTIEPFKK